jgi:pimeloyl-ACP methyl ester carboxylesterase
MRDTVEIAGHRIEVERLAGAAPERATLVFLHEGLGSIAGWRIFPRDVVAATGHPALVFSRRGYGQSEPRPAPWPLDFMHDEARRVLPALLEREGIEDAVLVGHSDGASIALIHAGDIKERVRAVVTLAPHVFVEDVCVRSIAALRDAYLDPKTKLRERLARHHADVDGAFHGWSGVWLDPEFREWDLRRIVSHIEVPVLVIQGDDDEYGTERQVRAVYEGVPGAASNVMLPRCGHAPHRDQPEQCLFWIERWLGHYAR